MGNKVKYFTISHGLRGCYMPDSVHVARCETRRELKNEIKSLADMIDSGQTLGISKRAIARFAAECWREAQKVNPAYLPYCLPLKEIGQSSYSYGIFCSTANKGEFDDQPQE